MSHKHKHILFGHNAHPVSKTVAIAVAVALMLPVANSWQQMSGSLRDFVGSMMSQEIVAK